MGRPNKGIDHVDGCDCSEQSRQRGKLILQTISGALSVDSACERMGIQRARFGVLRARALQGYVDAIEPGPPGRPRERDAEQGQREAELLAKIASLEHQVEVAEARALVSHVQREKKGGTPPPPRGGKRR